MDASSYWAKTLPCETAIEAGLRFGDIGTHTSRTIMLRELTDLLAELPVDAAREEYPTVVINENLLGKPTTATRKLTYQRLSELYGLDVKIPIFRILRRLWELDEKGRPLLAVLCALGRDPLLRATAPTVLSLGVGEELVRQVYLGNIKQATGERFNDSTLDAVARNSGSSWSQSGHLEGRVRKIRKTVEPTPYTVAYALWIGSQFLLTGEELFKTPWVKVLDRDQHELHELTLRAKQLRLVDANIGGGIIEINPSCIDLVTGVT